MLRLPGRLCGELLAHGLHLGESVLALGAVGGGDALVQAVECHFSAAELRRPSFARTAVF
jgi:hypothetical protein